MQCACWRINSILLAETALHLPYTNRSLENNEWTIVSCRRLPLRGVKSIKYLCVSPLRPGMVCLPACLPVWMEGGLVWLHLPLPVLHRAPQTSLSFICQQQPVIRIPLPAGPDAEESRCGSLRQQADLCSSCCSTLDTVLTFSHRAGYHGSAPHKQYLFPRAVRGIYQCICRRTQTLTVFCSPHPSRMLPCSHRDIKIYRQQHVSGCCDKKKLCLLRMQGPFLKV